jgi:adenosylmethionine-8-amino-7-oxononanoate aminotransferase
MTGCVIVGTDTDAGKTTFAMLFLAVHAERFDYWKPVETGEPDSLRVRRLVPAATVHEPLARFREPAAPCLAAQREGRAMPGVAEIVAATPSCTKPLLIETFGGPLSPLTDEVLQSELIRSLHRPVILVASSKVGAVGRTLATVRALAEFSLRPAVIVLVGPRDKFAESQIARHTGGLPVVSVWHPPVEWTAESLGQAANEQREVLSRVAGCLDTSSETRSGLDPTNLLERDRAAVWHPYSSLVDPVDPLPVVAAEREFLHLADGRTLVDAISSWWTILHGHRHPPLMQALAEASEALDHVLFAGVTHRPAVELAELLLASAPWSGGRVFYSDNGSTAVEVALKMAYQFWRHRGEPKRTLFVGFENGYHGDTFGAMAVGRDPLFFGAFEPLLFRALQVPLSADRLDRVLSEHRGQAAAVILEPLVQGAGGMRMHSTAELKAIFEATKRHDVLFIADEVMTGCRTSRLWAHQHAGIAPDLICSAKTLTGGTLPLAATLASPEIVAAFQTPDRSKTFFHGHSFTANPLTCAVAAANWRSLATNAWKRESERIETYWRAQVAPLRDQPGVKDVRICGTIAAVELDCQGGYLAEIGPRIRAQAISRGVLLRPLGSVVYALPPLCTSEESLGRIAGAIAAGSKALL